MEHMAGNSSTTGLFQDFSSPYSANGFPVVPVAPDKNEDAPAPDAQQQQQNEQDALKAQSEAAQTDLENPADIENGNNDQLLRSAEANAEQPAPAEDTQPQRTKNYPKNYFGMSLIGVHLYAELGQISDYDNKVKDLKDAVAADNTTNLSDARDKQQKVQTFAGELEQDGYLMADAQGNLLTPVIISSDFLRGMLSFELSYRLAGKVNFTAGQQALRVASDLAACDTYATDLITNGNTAANPADCASAIGIDVIANPGKYQNCITATPQQAVDSCSAFKLASDSSVNLKGVTGPVLALGYSTLLSEINGSSDWTSFDIFLGLKYRYYSLKSYDVTYTLSNLNKNEKFEDIIKRNEKAVSVHDLEPGVLLVSNNYQVGLGIDHLLSPSVAYARDPVKLKAKPYLTASVYNLFGWGRELAFSWYEDLAKEVTLYGTENRWRVLTLSYASADRWYIPGIRLGKRYNLERTVYINTSPVLSAFVYAGDDPTLLTASSDFRGIAKYDKKFGLRITGLSVFYEVGNVDELVTKYDALRRDLAATTFLGLSDLLATRDKANQFLRDLEDDGYAMGDAKADFLSPALLSAPFLQGMLSLEINYIAGGKMRFLYQDGITIQTDYPNCLNYALGDTSTQISAACLNELNTAVSQGRLECIVGAQSVNDVLNACRIFTLNSESLLRTKYYNGFSQSLGYQRFIYKTGFGEFFMGLKLTHYGIDTYESVYVFSRERNAANSDILKRNKKSISVFDLSASVVLVNTYLNFGLGAEHINSPEVNYSVSNVKIPVKPYITAYLYNFWGLKRIFSLYWHEDLSYDKTLYDERNQWRILRFNIEPGRWYIPALRLGMRQNKERSKLTYAHIGMSLFNFIHADLEQTNQNVNLGSSKIPRSLIAKLSLDYNFNRII
ncbi:hypothetical protein CHS0354_018530 [Potamilus streckersoni]|uniref:Uncharacterized protein n=1 Tax=Potamilus streckersoni TaxID=2493646 RepID=A0AAE0TBR0_9BIVA|nr:hypothetical protein CHS0354_018530 [Potamilus streckersoni]